jgi:hypothetical protein
VDFRESQGVGYKKQHPDADSSNLKLPLVSGQKGLIIAILSFVVFAYCYGRLRAGNDFHADWLNWMVVEVGLGGLLVCAYALFSYGVYLLSERSQLIR